MSPMPLKLCMKGLNQIPDLFMFFFLDVSHFGHDDYLDYLDLSDYIHYPLLRHRKCMKNMKNFH